MELLFLCDWGKFYICFDRPTLVTDLVKTIDLHLHKRFISMVEDPKDTLRLRRSLGILNGIIKEFASIKLPNGIKAMAQVRHSLCSA